jgi:Ca2+-binding EF-hand superfamily protein
MVAHTHEGYEESENEAGDLASGRIQGDVRAYLNAEQKRRRRRDANVAAGIVVGYIATAAAYFCPEQGWSVVDAAYFAFSTVTTVGYGDLNGGSDSGTMMFTTAFALAGVSLIGVAIGEIVEEIRVVRASKKRLMIEKVATALLEGKVGADTNEPHCFKRWCKWLKKGPANRLFGILIRAIWIGFMSVLLLSATEEDDSDIMSTSDPLTTCWYVGVVTGLTVGYGDFSPSSQAGRCLFIFYIPFSVIMMLQCLEEVNEIVRIIRTETWIEVVDIREIMAIDTSGEGQIDMNEYVRHMLESTGQVDHDIMAGMEAQFNALDTTQDGTLCMLDFPEGMGMRKEIKTFAGASTTHITVVPLPVEETAECASPEPKGALSAAKASAAKARKAAAALKHAPNQKQGTEGGDGASGEKSGAPKGGGAFGKKRMGGDSGAGHGKEAVISLCVVMGFLIIACAFYGTVMGWGIADCVYFSLATITTVGFGDFNGSHDAGTMVFTCFFGFLGVGLVGCAVGEVLQALHEIHDLAQKKMMEKVANDILAGAESMVVPGAEIMGGGVAVLKNIWKWTQETLIGRLIRVFLPMLIVGFLGSAILLATEEADSDIMQSSDPLVTAFYVSIITGLGVGYGDFYPTSPTGRGLFIMCMPVFIVAMMEVANEVSEFVRWARTEVTIETVPIASIMEMDDSGEGTIDVNEYVMYMLESTGQVDQGILRAFEHQFSALDRTRDGHITLEDFPEGMGLQKTHSKFKAHQTTLIEVVNFTADEVTTSKLAQLALASKMTVQEKLRQTCHTTTQDRIDYVVRDKRNSSKQLQTAARTVGPATSACDQALGGVGSRSADDDSGTGDVNGGGGVDDGGGAGGAAHEPAHEQKQLQHTSAAPAAPRLAEEVQRPQHCRATKTEVHTPEVAATPAASALGVATAGGSTGGKRAETVSFRQVPPLAKHALESAESDRRLVATQARKAHADQAGVRPGRRLAIELEEGIWDYGTIIMLGVAPARRGAGPGAVDPLRAGHVSAEVAFLDGEREWHDFDLKGSTIDVSDGWVSYRFPTSDEYSQQPGASPTMALSRPGSNPNNGRVLV